MSGRMKQRNPEFDVFLSYNRRDQSVVESLAQALRERDLLVFKDDWYLKPGEFWPEALEEKLANSKAVVVAIGRNGLGPWQKREVVAALERQSKEPQGRSPGLRVIPVLLDPGSRQQAGLLFLLQNTWVENWDPRAADLIAGAVRGRAPAEVHDGARTDPRVFVCPYRGLCAFREEDSSFYFGREAEIDRLATMVAVHPVIAIVGASGSGKSSLARAGLFPRLRRRTGEQVWQVVDMVPGGDPFRALARALLPLREPERILSWSKGDIDDECERLEHYLERNGAEYLTLVVRQTLEEERGTTRLLLLVDQWEELYTYRQKQDAGMGADSERVRLFIRMLLEAVRGEALRVILTLRADYWGEVLNDERLAASLPDDAVVHLRALDREALEAVIRRPAESAGLTVSDALIEAMLHDAMGQPGDLPLLEFALEQLWVQRAVESSKLTLEAYRAMGGLERAIVNRAGTVYAALDRRERDAVPGVFAALVQVGEARTDLRRRAHLSELSEAGQTVARRLADERLLVTSRDWSNQEDCVEVAHEALLRHWSELKTWIDERRSALLTIRQLQTDARNWVEKEKNASYLWSHERVREVVSALASLGQEVVLNDQERQFLGPVDATAMLAELDLSATTHERRALIGERLDVLSLARSGVDVDPDGTPDVCWCPVPGGEVAIGTQPLRKQVDTFQIARYPITVCQYRAFLEAEDGWRDPQWWADDLYRDPDGDSYSVGRYSSHPAVYVSWFDALAFCRWLSRRLDVRVVRLPNEWEWQQAATGGDMDNVFPWGSGWHPKSEPHRANTLESRLGRVTAVGMYPAGVNRLGALDMAGTVWEWCLNKFETPEVTASRSNDFGRRTARGGSWGGDQADANCAGRLWSLPDARYDSFGIRVVAGDES